MNVEPAINHSQYCILVSKERLRSERAYTKLEARLKAFQESCRHQNTRFQGDPAGGNDSCYICNLCNKVL